MRGLASAGALVLCASFAAAQTTLYIPGFDPQPITADVEGVDAQGRTTWRIGPGVTSGTYQDPAGIEQSATLVEGPTDAHLVYNDVQNSIFLSEDCAISNGIAVCTEVGTMAGIAETDVETETATGFVIQGASTTAAPSGNSGTSANTNTKTNTGSSSTPTAGSVAGSGPSATDTATPTGTGNGAGRAGTSMLFSLGAIGLVSGAFFL